MHRFWIHPKDIQGKELYLKEQLFHHVFRVCRMHKGQQLIFVSQGVKYLAQIEEISKNQAKALVLQKTNLPELPRPRIHLALSCPRFSVLENLLQKSVELGVSDFHPFVSELSFVRKTNSIQANRLKRWEKIIQNATSQSLYPQEMKLHSPCSLSELLHRFSQSEKAQGLFFYEGEKGRSAREVFSSLKTLELENIWLFLGSEGGFSSSESSVFESYQLEALTLGTQILKVETACLTVLGILKYILKQI